MSEIKFEIIKNFGPSVFKVKIPDEIVEKLNGYVDKIVEDKKRSETLNHGKGLAGDVTQEFKLEKNFMLEVGWGNFLAKCVSKWVELETGKKITKFEMGNSWIVRQFKNEYNPTHWHDRHISGAGFLKLPSTFGKHVQDKGEKKYLGGNLQLIHGSRMFLCHSTITIEPQIGDFYFFPNYLMHTVFPFKDTKEERRSISFNAKIDDNIYNVYRG